MELNKFRLKSHKWWHFESSNIKSAAKCEL